MFLIFTNMVKKKEKLWKKKNKRDNFENNKPDMKVLVYPSSKFIIKCSFISNIDRWKNDVQPEIQFLSKYSLISK